MSSNIAVQNPAGDASRGHGGRHRMTYWRWLLFAVMARLQAPEDEYLRVPNATTCDVHVKIT